MSFPPLLKPKATPSAVQGRITVIAEDGAKVGSWGGTECYLSRESNLGPCLVVSTIANKKRRTRFPLAKVHRVLSFHVSAGKLTVMSPHEKRAMVSIFIETQNDVEELQWMAAVLQDRNLWPHIERSVTKGQNRLRSSSSNSGGGGASLPYEERNGAPTATATAFHERFDGQREALDVYMHPEREDGDGVEDVYEEEARNAAAVLAAGAWAAAQPQQPVKGQGTPSAASDGPALQEPQQPVRPPAAALEDAKLGFATAPLPSPSALVGPSTVFDPAVVSASGVLTLSALNGADGRRRPSSPTPPPLPDCPSLALVAHSIAQGSNCFITGPPGTGKTALLLRLVSSLGEGEGESDFAVLRAKHIAMTAATGHAARYLGGATLSAFAGVPAQGSVSCVDSVVARILGLRSHRPVLMNWLSTDLLIVDDVNEVSAQLFTLVSEVGKRVRQAALEAGLPVSGVPPREMTATTMATGSDGDGGGGGGALEEDAIKRFLARPFGGLQLVVLGDYLAMPPPLLSHAGEEVLPAFASSAWSECGLQCVRLAPNRSVGPQGAVDHEKHTAYKRFLEDLRVGEYTVAVDDVVVACVDRYQAHCLASQGASPRETKQGQRTTLKPVIVVASPREAERINARHLSDALDGGAGTATDRGEERSPYVRYTSEDYAARPGTDMDAEVNFPSSLLLCRGAQVMLLAPSNGFRVVEVHRRRHSLSSPTPSYGSIGIVVGFVLADGGDDGGLPRGRGTEDRLPVVRFFHPVSSAVDEDGDGDDGYTDVVVPMVALEVREQWRESTEEAPESQLVLSRTQLPLRLAFALPVSALRHTPALHAVQLRVDKSFFVSAAAAARANGARRATNTRGSEEEEEEEVSWVNQWGLVLTALCTVRTADELYLERFNRRILRKAVHAEAKAFYESLFPLSAEEANALSRRREVERAVLTARKKQRSAEKGVQPSFSASPSAASPNTAKGRRSGGKRLREEARGGGDDEDTAFLTSAGGTSMALAATAERDQGEDDNLRGVPAGDSFKLPLLTQDSMVSAVTDLVSGSQVRTMVRGLLMDDDDDGEEVEE